MACDLTASLGTCAQVTAGNPHGGRGTCAGAGTSCGGQCTAASATACSYPGAETVCRSATCTNGADSASQTSAASCDGGGACGAGVTTACGIYMCAAGGVCATTCAGDFDCAAGTICQSGACQAKGAAAAPCTATSQCAAGLTCKDGVCCESACADALPRVQPARPGRPLRGGGVGRRSGFVPERHAQLRRQRRVQAERRAGVHVGRRLRGRRRVHDPLSDADGDSFGDRAATVANGKAKQVCGGAAGGGWVTSNTDCCDAGDTNKAVHPGQTGWFTAPGPCGIQFDYDCDGAMTPQYPAAGACDTATCSAGFVAATACGAMGDFQACDPAMAGVCATPAAQVQGCR